MYKRIVFVVLSYQWPSPNAKFGDLLSLPTISLSHVNRMQLHSLRIHHSIIPADQPNVPIKSCIVLADDLEAFCCAARGPDWIVPDGIVVYHHSLGLWWTLYGEGRVLSNNELSIFTVEEEVHQLEVLDDLPHQAHDPDQQAVLSAEVLPYERCSVSQLSFPATSFYKNIECLKQYNQIRGWYEIPSPKALNEKT